MRSSVIENIITLAEHKEFNAAAFLVRFDSPEEKFTAIMDTRRQGGLTAVHVAAMMGSPVLINALLADLSGEQKDTLILDKTRPETGYSSEFSILYLPKRGKNTPLWLASSDVVASALITHLSGEAESKLVEQEGLLAHLASKNYSNTILEVLQDTPCPLESIHKALFSAAEDVKVNSLKALINGDHDISPDSFPLRALLSVAARKDHFPMIAFLLDTIDNLEIQPSLTATQQEALLRVYDKNGNNALHYAAANDYQFILQMLTNAPSSIEKDAQLSVPNHEGKNPIQVAKEAGKFRAYVFLLENLSSNALPIKLAAQDENLDTGLHHLIAIAPADDIVRLLESIPPQIKEQLLLIQNKQGNTALHLAMDRNDEEIVIALLKGLDDRSINIVLSVTNHQGLPTEGYGDYAYDMMERIRDRLQDHESSSESSRSSSSSSSSTLNSYSASEESSHTSQPRKRQRTNGNIANDSSQPGSEVNGGSVAQQGTALPRNQSFSSLGSIL